MLQRRNLSLTFLDFPPVKPENAPLMLMLHGYGSNEKDLMQLSPLLLQGMRYISARAPVFLDFGMFGWFPIAFTPNGITVDYDAAADARDKLIVFIRELISEYRPSGNKIYLLGFSQGTVMSYLTAFHAPELLHGVMALSGQLPGNSLQAELKPELQNLPFLVMHGLYDDILPIEKGRQANEWLQQHVRDLVYREYPVAHQIPEEGIRLVRSWLEEKVPQTERKA